MSRLTGSVLAMAMSFIAAQSAHADFLLGDPFAILVHNDGTIAVQPTGGPPIVHESYDTFTLSTDAQRIYMFGNDLGTITVESWSAVSGLYLGSVGTPYPPPYPGYPWPNNIQPNAAIGEVHTRSTFPTFGGDLLYVGPLGIDSGGFGFINKPVINVVNTTTHQFVEQIVPPASVTEIYDFTLGPGTLGPKTRTYVSTNSGLFAFNETPPLVIGFDPNTDDPIYGPGRFTPVSSTPLPISMSRTASFDVGPDGYLYVLDGAGSASSIKRYNTATGALVDTFLTFAEYNYGGIVGDYLKFGPDGGLYFSSVVRSSPNPHTYITRFDIGSRQRTDFDLGRRVTFDFYVMPIPEPSSIILLLVASISLTKRVRVC